MEIKGIFCIFFCVWCFFSCKNPENTFRQEVILSVIPEKTIDLTGEKLPIEEFIPTGVCRIDTFLVIINGEEEKILKVYQANTFRFLGAFLSKGRGPGEIIFCQRIWGERTPAGPQIWVKAPQNYIGVLDLNRSLDSNEVCWEKQYNFLQNKLGDFLYRSVFLLNDSIFLISCAEKPYQIIPSNNIIKHPDGGIEIKSWSEVKDVPPQNMYWLKYNYSSATVLDTIWYSDYKDLRNYERIFGTWEDISPDREKVAVAYEYMNQLMLMDLTTLQSRWITPESVLPLPYGEELEYNMYYSGVCCTNERIFAFRAFPVDPRLNRKEERIVQVFDWKGHLKYQLNVSHPLKYPFLDEEKGYLYAMDEEDAIRRYDIRAFL